MRKQTVAIFILDDLNRIKTAQRIEYLSNRDELTGTYNRNCYIRTLTQIRESSLNSMGIIYVDINGQRIIKNKYGCQFGDNCIATCAQLLKGYFKDNIYRIGADEFLIILKILTIWILIKKSQS